jgi:hypothetical protein
MNVSQEFIVSIISVEALARPETSMNEAGLVLYSEYRGSNFLRNVAKMLSDYTALRPGR